jgi:hypothetical protein
MELRMSFIHTLTCGYAVLDIEMFRVMAELDHDNDMTDIRS